MLKRCKHSVEGISLMLFSESYFSQRASTIITRGKKADYQLVSTFRNVLKVLKNLNCICIRTLQR